MSRGICQTSGCDCERFIASWSPTVCALCRHTHTTKTPPAQTNSRPSSFHAGQQPQSNLQQRSGVAQQPLSFQRGPPPNRQQSLVMNRNAPAQQSPSLSQQQSNRQLPKPPLNRNQSIGGINRPPQVNNSSVPPPRPSVPAPSTIPTMNQPKTSQTPRETSPTAKLTLSDPQVIKFFNSLDQALKKTRKRGLTKKEAEKLLQSGLLMITNGQLKVNTSVLQASTGQQNPQIQSSQSRVPVQPLRVPSSSSINTDNSKQQQQQQQRRLSTHSTTPPKRSAPSSSVRSPSPGGVTQRQQAEIKQLRIALEKERTARKSIEFELEKQKNAAPPSSKKNQTLENRIKELENRIRERDNFVHQIEKQNKEYKDQIHDFESKENIINEFSRKFQEKIKARETEILQLKEDLSTSKTCIFEIEQKFEEKKRQLKESKQNLERMERENQNLLIIQKEENEKYKKRLEDYKNFSEKQIQHLTKRLEESELIRISSTGRNISTTNSPLTQKRIKSPSSGVPGGSLHQDPSTASGSPSDRLKLLSEIENLTQERNSFDERSQDALSQLDKLKIQFQDSEDARKEIATRILQLQLQFADTLEEYERRFAIQRRQSNESFSLFENLKNQIDKLSTFSKEFENLILSIDQRKIKDKSLFNEIKNLFNSLHQTSSSLTNTQNQSKQSIQIHEQKTNEFLNDLEIIRKQVREIIEICDKDTNKLLEDELYKSKTMYEREINQYKSNYQREFKIRCELEEKLEKLQEQNHQLSLLRNNYSEASDEKNLQKSSSSSNQDAAALIAFNEDLQNSLECEIKMRQETEEENQQLIVQLNQLNEISNDFSDLQSKFFHEKNQLQNEFQLAQQQYQENLNELRFKLEEADRHRANLEKTKNALESTIDMLSIQNESTSQNIIDPSTIENAVKEERKRNSENIKILEDKIDILQNQLDNAEKRAIDFESNENIDELIKWKKILEENLENANRENAALSAQLDATRAQFQSYNQTYDDYDIPLPPDEPPPPIPPREIDQSIPSSVPLPPPPPPPSNSSFSSSGRAGLLSDIQNVDRNKLKPVEVPDAVVAPSRMDLMAEIRGGASSLRRVERKEGTADAPKFEDPQNMLQVLARVLLTRREGIENDDEDEGEDESWDA